MAIILIRTLILYGIVIFSVRMMGKRQIGELQPSELVVAILISNIATLALEEVEIPLMHGVLPILLLVCFEVLTSCLSLRSVQIRRWISGRDGEIDQEMLHTLRFSIDDMMTALRMKGIFSVEEVQYAVVETNGSVSVCQKAAQQPATKEDVHTAGRSLDPPQIIIADGCLRENGLAAIGQDRQWLDTILRTAELSQRDVFLLTADSACRYHLVRQEGRKRT